MSHLQPSCNFQYRLVEDLRFYLYFETFPVSYELVNVDRGAIKYKIDTLAVRIENHALKCKECAARAALISEIMTAQFEHDVDESKRLLRTRAKWSSGPSILLDNLPSEAPEVALHGALSAPNGLAFHSELSPTG